MNPRFTSPEEKSTLRERLAYLENKNEALCLEVSHLTEQNTKLSDQIELMRKINQKLKQKLTMNLNKESYLLNNSSADISPLYQRQPKRAITAFCDQSPTQFSNENTLPPISEKTSNNYLDEKNKITSMAMILDSLKDIETPPIQQIKKFFPFEIKNSPLAVNEGDIPAKSPILNLDPQKLIEDHEKYTQKIEQEELRDLQLMLEEILNNPNKFQEVNNLVKIGPYSPFSKTEVNKSEKYIEGAENIIKKWVKQLEEMNKNCLTYTKSIETFGTQLLMDKSFFKDNVELQTLLTLIAQVLKEHAIYIEVFTQVVQDSIENPLKLFYKNNLRLFKESKKKAQKALEEYEANQTKYLTIKKASIFKDTNSGHSLQRAYIHSLKSFEIARLEHIHCLNETCIEINKELVQKLCTFVTGRMEHLDSSYQVLHGIEKQINLFLGSVGKKIEIQEKFNEDYGKIKSEVNENIYTHYTRPSLPNIIKEGYLFIKTENKDFKKKYCMICEDSIFYLVKEADSGLGEPKINELANLKLCNVKPSHNPEHQFCFELVDAAKQKPILIQTETELATNEWINTIRQVTERALSREPSIGALQTSFTKSDTENKDIKNKTITTCTTIGNENFGHQSQQKNKQALITLIIKNNVCADCGAKDPSWISLNLGVIICINCSGAHRQFGPNVSKVRSLKLDNLTLVVLRLFSKLPTKEVNKLWEGLLDETPSIKPNIDSEKEKRIEWVKLKYVDKVIIKSVNEEDHIELLCKAIENEDILKVLHILINIRKNLNELSMIEGRKQTVLHHACAKSNPEIVELLLRNGCNVNQEDQDHCKPIDSAMCAHKIDIMEHLNGKNRTFEI